MPTVRPAAVAGAFYPGDPQVLTAQLGELLGAPDAGAEAANAPKAVIVPHAGYVYSGAVAARAYEALAAARDSVTRVVLLGPVHRVEPGTQPPEHDEPAGQVAQLPEQRDGEG